MDTALFVVTCVCIVCLCVCSCSLASTSRSHTCTRNCGGLWGSDFRRAKASSGLRLAHQTWKVSEYSLFGCGSLLVVVAETATATAMTNDRDGKLTCAKDTKKVCSGVKPVLCVCACVHACVHTFVHVCMWCMCACGACVQLRRATQGA